MSFLRYLVWVTARAVCIVLAAPHASPPWPLTRKDYTRFMFRFSMTVAAGFTLVLVALLLAVAGFNGGAYSPCADAFALCQGR